MHGSYKLNIIEHQQTQMNNKTNEILSLREHILSDFSTSPLFWLAHMDYVNDIQLRAMSPLKVLKLIHSYRTLQLKEKLRVTQLLQVNHIPNVLPSRPRFSGEVKMTLSLLQKEGNIRPYCFRLYRRNFACLHGCLTRNLFQFPRTQRNFKGSYVTGVYNQKNPLSIAMLHLLLFLLQQRKTGILTSFVNLQTCGSGHVRHIFDVFKFILTSWLKFRARSFVFVFEELDLLFLLFLG